jgi:hypothetical protein
MGLLQQEYSRGTRLMQRALYWKSDRRTRQTQNKLVWRVDDDSTSRHRDQDRDTAALFVLVVFSLFLVASQVEDFLREECLMFLCLLLLCPSCPSLVCVRSTYTSAWGVALGAASQYFLSFQSFQIFPSLLRVNHACFFIPSCIFCYRGASLQVALLLIRLQPTY